MNVSFRHDVTVMMLLIVSFRYNVTIICICYDCLKLTVKIHKQSNNKFKVIMSSRYEVLYSLHCYSTVEVTVQVYVYSVACEV